MSNNNDTNINESMQQLQTPSNYGFSATGLDQLGNSGASEYTLATILVDVSGSVQGFAKELEKCLKTILESCKSSPRSDNLLLRVVSFNNDIREIHGFRLISEINASEYDNTLNPYGGTSLFDAVISASEATGEYGKLLVDQEFMSNGVVYVLTDGCDNGSSATPSSIKKTLGRISKEEKLESIAIILIMVGTADSGVTRALDKFKNDAEITQFVDMTDLFNDAKPEKQLAKLAGFVSRSISSTSQALSSGSSNAASSNLTF